VLISTGLERSELGVNTMLKVLYHMLDFIAHDIQNSELQEKGQERIILFILRSILSQFAGHCGHRHLPLLCHT
jgi:hypothetical protein